MPFKSQAQAGAMYAAAKGKGRLGIPKKVARDYISHSRGKIAKLPRRKAT